MSLVAACSGCSKEPPKAEEGVVYQTKAESFWVGVGQAYMTFENVAEPEQKEENALYGNVFYVRVSSDSGKTYSPWLSGKWEINDAKTELTLTASWESGDKATSLADATSGEAKKYTADGGKFTIGVNLPSAGKVNFTLDPVNDKVGEGETPTPPAECTEHVDENKDGKCDKCGKDMPNQGGDEVTVMTLLEAATIGGQKARLELKSDKSWELSVSYYEGGDYTPTASGTWALDATTYNITLNVTGDAANVLADDTYMLNVDYTTQKYSGTIVCNVPQIGEISFAFTQTDLTPPAAEVQSTLNATSAGGQKAKIELLKDNTWNLSIKYWDGGDYTPTASGTWAMSTTDYNITLTVTKDDASVLAEDNYLLTVDYTTFAYSGTIACTVPQLGKITFAFSSATTEGEHYTVSYDLNYEGAPSIGAATTETFDGGDAGKKEYVKTAPETPVREGYKFAGWYTVKNPVLSGGAAETEYLFGTKLSAYNSAPASIKNDVMAITENTTLYARWAECKEISNAAQLKEIANDLTGWYKLTANITLTEEWTPVGLYYASYEFYEPNWWLYSFRGTLDGNGHKISGLQLNTLDFADTAITEKEGSADGTTGFFASAVNCTVKNLTIDGARITIADYKQDTHAYVSVLAAFVQGSNTLFENCTVSNATISVSCENVWYYGISGLFAGHWGGHANNCNVIGGSIALTATYTKAATKSDETIYVGGLVGEGYAWLDNCDAKTTVSLTINDSRAEVSTPMNVYYGGAMASSTYLNKVTYEGNISLDYTKSAGAVNVYYGGVSGYQRYGYINNCYSKAAMNFVNNNANVVDGQKFTAGGILGAYDTMYGLMGAAYFFIPGGCRVSNCLDNSAFTATGAAVFASDLAIIGFVPADAVVDAYNQSFNVDMTNFKRADGSYTFFGAFNCVKVSVGGTAGTDVDGNVTVTSESAVYGEAVKETLGDGWTYTANELPTPKAAE